MQKCELCGVVIEGDVVKFSFGKPGTRARLAARVCNFVKDESKKAMCANRNFDGEITANDCYGDATELPLPKQSD